MTMLDDVIKYLRTWLMEQICPAVVTSFTCAVCDYTLYNICTYVVRSLLSEGHHVTSDLVSVMVGLGFQRKHLDWMVKGWSEN